MQKHRDLLQNMCLSKIDIFKFVSKSNAEPVLKLNLRFFQILFHCVYKKRTFYLNTERQNIASFCQITCEILTVSRFLMTSDAITTIAMNFAR